jgi:putative flavoprotein involved in K+ transport
LLGRLEGVENGIIKLGGDLHDNLAAADRAEAEFTKAVDAYIAATAVPAPEETLPVLCDGFDQKILTELDLTASGITNVIWATGYSFDFSFVKLPVTDGDGFPIQTRGVSAYRGLFFVGLPWLHTAKSGLIYGLAEDARYIADRIAERRTIIEAASIVPPPGRSLEQVRSHATSRWADRVMTLIWLSALSLMLDGFAGYAAGIYPTASQIPPHQADSAIAPTDATPSQR